MTDFKPMLAGKVSDPAKLVFPLLASPKLDGIRCVVREGRVLSRTLKPIPNDYVRACLEQDPNLEGCDGELLLPNMTEPFAEVTSAIMSRDGEPDFVFAVFDWTLSPGLHFRERLERLRAVPFPGFARLVDQCEVLNAAHLMGLHTEHVADGFEGTMVRRLDAPYKHGRSTEREGYLLKMKVFEDEEAKIVGFVEEMENRNEQTRDELGRAKRSSAQAGKVGKGTLGAFKLQFVSDGTEFECGSGLNDMLAAKIWAQQADYLGRLVTVKHQPPPGGRSAGDKPRIPVFKGFRED